MVDLNSQEIRKKCMRDFQNLLRHKTPNKFQLIRSHYSSVRVQNQPLLETVLVHCQETSILVGSIIELQCV